jgi:hypothetical protein
MTGLYIRHLSLLSHRLSEPVNTIQLSIPTRPTALSKSGGGTS